MGSWVVYPTGDQWIDPFAISHGKSSSLGFADGHADNHKWQDEDTLEMAEKQEFFSKIQKNVKLNQKELWRDSTHFLLRRRKKMPQEEEL